MNPFAQIIELADRLELRRNMVEVQDGASMTQTERLVQFIKQNPGVRSRELAELLGRTVNLVSALLKHRKDNGEIYILCGQWYYDDAYDDEQQARERKAVHLLRRLGYVVTEPAANAKRAAA